jgi:hypothetical protein
MEEGKVEHGQRLCCERGGEDGAERSNPTVKAAITGKGKRGFRR